MIKDTSKYELVPDVDKYYFKCLEHQIIAIAYNCYGEYWRLFIGQKIDINFSNTENLDGVFAFYDYIIDNAKKYYGMSFESVSTKATLEFNSNQLYLVAINNKYYPLSAGVNDGEHMFLVYGYTEEGYLVFDNFYQETAYVLDHKISQYFNAIYLVECQGMSNKDHVEEVKNGLLVVPKWIEKRSYEYINVNFNYEYKPSELYDALRNVASYVKRDSIVMRELINGDEYIEACVNIINLIAHRVKLIQSSLLKVQLKFDTIPNTKFVKQINEVIKYLLCQYKVRNEVSAILSGESCLKDRLKIQLLQYFKLHNVDSSNFVDSSSVFELHDKASIMYLINYYEECNDIEDISLEVYTECNTYREYMLATYKEILCNNLAI